MISQMADLTASRRLPHQDHAEGLPESGITHADVDHLMIYDAFAQPIPSTVSRTSGSSGGARPASLLPRGIPPPAGDFRSTPTVVGSPIPTPACTACLRCRNPYANSAGWRPPRLTGCASVWCTGWAACLLRPAPSCSATKRPDRHRRGLEGPGGRRAFSVAAAPSLLNRANLSFRKEGAAKCAAGHGQTGRLVGPRSEARPVAARSGPPEVRPGALGLMGMGRTAGRVDRGLPDDGDGGRDVRARRSTRSARGPATAQWPAAYRFFAAPMDFTAGEGMGTVLGTRAALTWLRGYEAARSYVPSSEAS